MDDIKDQLNKLQIEIQENEGSLLQENEGTARQELKEIIERKRKQLSDLQLKTDEADGLLLPRRSECTSIPTEKMAAYLKEECSTKEKALIVVLSCLVG